MVSNLRRAAADIDVAAQRIGIRPGLLAQRLGRVEKVIGRAVVRDELLRMCNVAIATIKPS